MKFTHHVTDMECECFCERETEVLECSVFRSLYERELMGNFGLFLNLAAAFPGRKSSLFSLLAELDCIDLASPSLWRK